MDPTLVRFLLLWSVLGPRVDTLFGGRADSTTESLQPFQLARGNGLRSCRYSHTFASNRPGLGSNWCSNWSTITTRIRVIMRQTPAWAQHLQVMMLHELWCRHLFFNRRRADGYDMLEHLFRLRCLEGFWHTLGIMQCTPCFLEFTRVHSIYRAILILALTFSQRETGIDVASLAGLEACVSGKS